ncbi:MAG: RDD family protein [Arenimonas sp.]
MSVAPEAAAVTEVAPAGFWRRYAAWSLDWLALSALLAFLLAAPLARVWEQLLALNALLQDWVFQRVVAAGGTLPSPVAMAFELLGDQSLKLALMAGMARLDATLVQVLLLVSGAGALYFIGFEAGPWQATPGKRLAGLQVRNIRGERLGVWHTVLRHASGILGWLTLNLGHALAAWRQDRRALHDLIAGAQVLASGPMPPWARTWLLMQAALLAALVFGSIGWMLWLFWQLATL